MTNKFAYKPKFTISDLRCPPDFIIIRALHAPVAKLDKALVYETRDYRFESCKVRQI